MYNIVYVLRKYSTVRALLFVALSLAMAVLVGQGLHPAGSNDQPGFVQSPARSAQPAAATGNSATIAARTSSLDNVSSLDQALKNMSSLERDRINSASVGDQPQMPLPKTEVTAAASTKAETTVKTLVDVNKKGQPTPQDTTGSASKK